MTTTLPAPRHPWPRSATTAAPAWRCRLLDPRSIDAADLAAWHALEDRAVEPNAYLSPHFVLPALHHLDPAQRLHLVLAERLDGAATPRLLGVGLVRAGRPSRSLPLPHLAGYLSRHSYLGHWWLDADHAADAAHTMLLALRRRHRTAAALALPLCPLDGPLCAAFDAAARRLGGALSVLHRQDRATLVPADSAAVPLRERLGAKQHANLERCKRRLQEQGTLTWHLLRQDADDAAIERFLALEHMGWKRDEGTSLRASAADEAFFIAMAQRFNAAGRGLFTELRLDGRAIASTANLVSAGMGFAFKVGWDEGLRKFSVGLLNEAAFVEHAAQGCADLHNIDSGAQPGSFIDTLWPGRRALGTLHIALHGPARLALAAMDRWRAKRAVGAASAAIPPSALSASTHRAEAAPTK